jgi:hypothetical protein
MKNEPIFNEIETVLARHYGFRVEELDVILNGDLKCRFGRDAQSEDGWAPFAGGS